MFENFWSISLQLVGAVTCVWLLVYSGRHVWNKIDAYHYESSQREADLVLKNGSINTTKEPIVRNRWQVQLLADDVYSSEELLKGVNYLSEDIVIQDSMVYFHSETEALCIPFRNIKYIKFIGDFTVKQLVEKSDEQTS